MEMQKIGGTRVQKRELLLPHNDAKIAAPTFCETYTSNFHLRRQMAQQCVGSGMKAQGWCDQVDDRGRGLQLDSGEISVPREITLLQVTVNAKLIIRGLQRKVDVFGGFQLQNR